MKERTKKGVIYFVKLSILKKARSKEAIEAKFAWVIITLELERNSVIFVLVKQQWVIQLKFNRER